jgi:hypothetical protein
MYWSSSCGHPLGPQPINFPISGVEERDGRQGCTKSSIGSAALDRIGLLYEIDFASRRSCRRTFSFSVAGIYAAGIRGISPFLPEPAPESSAVASHHRFPTRQPQGALRRSWASRRPTAVVGNVRVGPIQSERRSGDTSRTRSMKINARIRSQAVRWPSRLAANGCPGTYAEATGYSR